MGIWWVTAFCVLCISSMRRDEKMHTSYAHIFGTHTCVCIKASVWRICCAYQKDAIILSVSCEMQHLFLSSCDSVTLFSLCTTFAVQICIEIGPLLLRSLLHCLRWATSREIISPGSQKNPVWNVAVHWTTFKRPWRSWKLIRLRMQRNGCQWIWARLPGAMLHFSFTWLQSHADFRE